MEIYLLVFLSVYFTGFVINKYCDKSFLSIYLFFVTGVLIVFMGIRDLKVGTDSGEYVSNFQNINNIKDVFESKFEIGFALLNLLSKQISNSYYSIFFAIGIISIPLYIYAIKAIIKEYYIGIYIYLVFGFYTFGFNGARQFMASAFCFWGYTYLLSANLYKFLIFVLIASMFHKSALLVLPIMYFYKKEIEYKNLINFSLYGLIFILLFKLNIININILIEDRYTDYIKSNNEGGGIVSSLFLLTQGFIFFKLKKIILAQKEVFNTFFNIYIFSFIPALINLIFSTNPSGLLRISNYFSCAAIVLWPIIFENIFGLKRIVVVSIFFIFTLFFMILTLVNFSNLVPYVLNREFS